MGTGKEDIVKRLRRIEGQVKGIERMINEDKCCNDILIQVAAARAAINKVGGIILENYSKNCIIKSLENNFEDDSIEKLVETIVKFTK